MKNDIDKAYAKRVQEALKQFLINQGIYESFDDVLIELTAGQLVIQRIAKRDLARFQKEQNQEGIDIATEVINETQKALDDAVATFGIDFVSHPELAQLLEQQWQTLTSTKPTNTPETS